MADAPQTTTVTPPGSDLDHLAGLHRMSRTAGVGGGAEYSAVNVAAVVALLIGVASALALMAPVFLFLPVVGVIIAAVAIKQIVSSNGTQTGLALAILALVLSVGLAGFTGLKALREVRQAASDTAALDALIGDFGKAIAAQDYDKAYALTDARFQDNVTRDAFGKLWEEFAKSPGFGRLTGIRSNKLFQIDADPESNARMAFGFALLDTEKLKGADAFRTDVRYRFTADEWKVFAIPQLFAAQKPAAAGNQQPSGAAGPPR